MQLVDDWLKQVQCEFFCGYSNTECQSIGIICILLKIFKVSSKHVRIWFQNMLIYVNPLIRVLTDVGMRCPLLMDCA